MKSGIFRIILIFAYFSIAVPFYGQSGGMGNSVLYRDRYRYVTVEKMEVETILEYIKVFQELYCSDLDKSFTRNGSYIENFNRQYYFQEHYVRLPYNVFLEIEVAYKKPLFSRQRQHIIEISFRFGYFPTFEEDGETERNVYSFIVETVDNFMSQFDEYVANNNIELQIQPLKYHEFADDSGKSSRFIYYVSLLTTRRVILFYLS